MLATLAAAAAFLYQPRAGQLWDPSCFAIDNGTFYCVSMYSEAGNSVYTSGWLATSADGVHWRDVGPIAPSEPGTQWWKGFVLQREEPPYYVLNHGVFEKGGDGRYHNDALRILTSSDLITWSVNSTSRPDAKWYHNLGRWDHMYMTRSSEHGFIGFPVSSPLDSSTYASTWPGVQRSADGIRWTAHAPLEVNWHGLSPQGIEEGGIERLAYPNGTASAYFLIGGGGAARTASSYSMWAYRAPNIDGPFEPLPRRFRLSGGSPASGFEFGALAVWCRGRGGERLISQYMTAPGKGRADVWMLPLRKPLVDASGTLRLAYWPPNDGLLGPPLADATPPPSQRTTVSCSAGGHSVSWLGTADVSAHRSGLYLNATFSAGGAGSVGLALGDFVGVPTSDDDDDADVAYTAMLLDVGDDDDEKTASRVLHLSTAGDVSTLDVSGSFPCGEGNLSCGVATLTAIAPAVAHHVLLFFANGMWELYIDDLLVQTFVYGAVYPLPSAGAGKIGLACKGDAHATIDGATIGHLDRSGEHDARLHGSGDATNDDDGRQRSEQHTQPEGGRQRNEKHQQPVGSEQHQQPVGLLRHATYSPVATYSSNATYSPNATYIRPSAAS
jgi:hypothetical protein